MDEPRAGEEPVRTQPDRRAVLRRGAVLGAALAWSTPAVQSLASPAFAAGSPLCETRVEVDDCTLVYEQSPDCCACVESHPELPLAEALALCARAGTCIQSLEVCGEEEEKPPPDNPPPSVNPPPGGDQVDVPTVIPAGS
jgi:hypothetical protein